VSGLVGLSLPERTEQPSAPPLALVPMPEGWRDQARELVATWPARAQLHLVEDVDLDWSDDTERGVWPSTWPTYTEGEQ
jgi:hypothetical protein